MPLIELPVDAEKVQGSGAGGRGEGGAGAARWSGKRWPTFPVSWPGSRARASRRCSQGPAGPVVATAPLEQMTGSGSPLRVPAKKSHHTPGDRHVLERGWALL
jgi:hypothetical protein